MSTNENGQTSMPDEESGVSKCIANSLGLVKDGCAPELASALVAGLTDRGKGNRNRFGRLVCNAGGCNAVCNVEVIDGIPTAKDLDQIVQLLANCELFKDCSVD